MTQSLKDLMKDSEEESARHHQHHHHHNHASTSTYASVVNFASVINSDPVINSGPATKGLTTKAVQSRISKKYVCLRHESVKILTCYRNEESDAQHHHDHNISTTASTTSSTVRGINLPLPSHKKQNLFTCHHHVRGQQQYENHHCDNAFAIASTSASTTNRSTLRGVQSSTSEEVILDPGSQDEQLAGVGSWVEEYNDSYGGKYL
ncbi:hypothetical protein EAE99_007071 [Botrytis elliptica]|nr:hypothetical protein EAE99_007071 [Botrytis elliptica]